MRRRSTGSVFDVLHNTNCIISSLFLDMYRINFYYLFHVSDDDAHWKPQGEELHDSIDTLESIHSFDCMAV